MDSQEDAQAKLAETQRRLMFLEKAALDESPYPRVARQVAKQLARSTRAEIKLRRRGLGLAEEDEQSVPPAPLNPLIQT